MRIIAVAVLVGILAAGAAAPAGADTRPAIGVGAAPTLTIVGTGFAPRSLVRIRVEVRASETVRTTTARAGAQGGFVVRFAGLRRCSPREVTAVAGNGPRVRVPGAWFVRECPPGPPLAPGTPVG